MAEEKSLAQSLEEFKSDYLALIEKREAEIKDLGKASDDTTNSIKNLTEQNNAMVEKAKVMQEQMDALDIKLQKSGAEKEIEKNFGGVFADAMKENFNSIKEVKKGQGFKMSLKAVGNMTLGTNLTGDSVVSYSGRQAILPSTKLNFRDLIAAVNSETGTYVQYKETAGEGSISVQTEGASKTQIDFDFAEVKTVNKYIAGYSRFSKQIMKSLPFLQGTLPRLLMREFFNAENSTFYTTVSGAATGSTTTAETDDVKAIIDYIANQRTAKFAASYGLVGHTQLGRLNKLTYTNGYYAGSGGVLTNVDGSMLISGMPVIPVDWVADDKILILDRDYIERVEVEGMNVEFFEQDSDNVTKNLMTARIEAYEEINLMLPSSAIFADLGNVA